MLKPSVGKDSRRRDFFSTRPPTKSAFRLKSLQSMERSIGDAPTRSASRLKCFRSGQRCPGHVPTESAFRPEPFQSGQRCPDPAPIGSALRLKWVPSVERSIGLVPMKSSFAPRTPRKMERSIGPGQRCPQTSARDSRSASDFSRSRPSAADPRLLPARCPVAACKTSRIPP